ncbi:MAG: ABC transporter permease [Burkholderiales bacterium]
MNAPMTAGGRHPGLGLWPYSLAGAAMFLCIWWLLPYTGVVSSALLPSPKAVGQTFAQLTQEPFAGYTIQEHVLSSFKRYAMGFGLAAVVGISLGLLMGWYRVLDRAVSPIFEAIRFIAPIAWLPFAVLWFGTGLGGPILIIFSGAFPACLLNAYRGAKLTQSLLIEAAQTLGARPRHIIAEVLLPSAWPSIIAGLRIGAGVGWQSLIGAELIVVSSGVGYLMVQGQSNLATEKVMAGMVAIGLVGALIDVALRAVERHFRRFELA